jgi:hypothetical protein
MPSRKSTLPTAVALLTLLGGCVTASPPGNNLVFQATPKAPAPQAEAERRAKRAPACPAQTDDAKAERILGYLEKALPDPGLDTLATEWERLNDGAGVCRSGVASIGGRSQ